MTTYLHQWMFLGLLAVIAATFAVDFVSDAVDSSSAQIVNSLSEARP